MPRRATVVLLAIAITLAGFAMMVSARTEAQGIEALVLTDIGGARISVKDEVVRRPVLLLFYREYG